MRTVSEHQKVVAGLLTRPAPVQVPLEQAAGRALAADLVAARPLPAFDNSAMDGYAVRAEDVAGAGAEHPVVLPVAEDVPAGRVDGPPLAPGTAHRIMTGAPMPAGADAVVQVEATDGGTTTVTIRESREPGKHVRSAGEDVRAGDTALPAGVVLGSAQLGLVAALGEPTVAVVPPLRVLVLSTGSELVEPGQPLQHGQIHESNGIMLASAVRAAGADAEQLHFVADDVTAFHAALQPRLAEVDLVITSGGVSAGAYEVVKDALTGQGVEFVKVAMQPGMPQGAGRLDGVPVVTLPGNPVSSLVSFEVFLRPAIRSAMGLPPGRHVVRARLSEPLDSPAGRRQFRRGVLDRATGTVHAMGPPASHFLRWMATSNCLLDLPEDAVHLAEGTEVDAWLID
ncbi:gephyrin-like molybdotransferase Glp [Rhodococcus sp. X156]|uniref:molybdopterin molybdotransferase MoeA n=1 Tax=Rhodococcus sp. X156 TaxID=2499145 RepID=UPI0013E33606|nr:gephyrin-like molybdotransferase Glp [Rhodococcus sp. X156]